MAADDALRPAKADLVEIEIGMLRADVVENTSHRPANSGIEPFGGVGVNRAAGVLAFGMLDRVVAGEILSDGDEGFPVIAHQMRFGSNPVLERQLSLKGG